MIIQPIRNPEGMRKQRDFSTFYEVTSKLVSLFKFTEAPVQVSSILVLTACCQFMKHLKPTVQVMHRQFNIQQL